MQYSFVTIKNTKLYMLAQKHDILIINGSYIKNFLQ
jgi:hypothetical protein